MTGFGSGAVPAGGSTEDEGRETMSFLDEKIWTGAVFSGGWELEAAEFVCTDETSATRDVLTGLDGLVGRSLVQAQHGRYRLLERLDKFRVGYRIAASEIHDFPVETFVQGRDEPGDDVVDKGPVALEIS